MSASMDLIKIDQISKVYPGVLALDKVSFSLKAGEVVGLIGENGAGKSTFMKILGGVTAASQGSLYLNGKKKDDLSVQDSLDAGIAFVHQELNLFDNLDVTANMFLGREKTYGPMKFVDTDAMAAEAQVILDRLGATFHPHTPVSEMSMAERQLLEIAKALSMNAKVVILDEPTSSLTIAESQKLLSIVADLKAHGVSIIFISHRLSEVADCADRVVVLRDGRVVGELDRGRIDHDAMINLMIGRELSELYIPPKAPPGEVVLKIDGMRTPANPDATVDLEARAGEILGLAGLMGAGRTELALSVFGIDSALQGEVSIGGQAFRRRSPAQAIERGIYLVPEDRKRNGLVLDLSVAHNLSLASLSKVARFGMVSTRAETERAEIQKRNLAIKTHRLSTAASDLSGGNQQKIVLGKWLAMKPRVIVFDEPTRGIDVGAKTEIYKLMRALSDEGVAVIMISSDMEEVVGVSDRVAVMHAGAVSGILERRELSEHNVLQLAVGNHAGVQRQ